MRSVVFFVFILIGCSTPQPVEEYTLARTALQFAKDQDAPRYAPSYWHQAEEAYRKGEVNFKNHDYGDAGEEFIKAKEFAEKAENATRAQKYKSGEFTP